MTRQLGIGIDFGGTGIKAAAVDLESGKLASERVRVKTPQPSTPERCIAAMREIVGRVVAEVPLDPAVPVGAPLGIVDEGDLLGRDELADMVAGHRSGNVEHALRRRANPVTH